ncbi:MAG: septum formation protein Maf [Anaerolineales bacterium]|nr:septum formation protein Maf [Anaerolineales bacterium]
MKFVIASASPRRKELFSLTGWEAEILPTDIPETRDSAETAGAYVSRLAAQKAQFAAAHRGQTEPAVILAADTIVYFEEQILEKPENSSHAYSMLDMLRGKTHQVCTAVALINTCSGTASECACITDVPMRSYAQHEIDRYIKSGSPLDKAGAYGIQDRDFAPVEIDKMNGCFANVMGLPLCHLVVQLRRLGILTSTDIPAACQRYNEYHCPVYASILGGEPCVEPHL